MLTVIREMAEEAEAHTRRHVRSSCSPPSCCAARTRSSARRECSTCSANAGVVDAGGAGLLEIVRGIDRDARRRADSRGAAGRGAARSTRSTRSCPSSATARSSSSRETGSIADALRQQLEQLGDSLLVVGDATALKVHVHTDDPGAALVARHRGRRARAGRDREHAQADGAARGASPPRRARRDARRERGRRGRRGRREPRAVREPRRARRSSRAASR